MENSKWPYMGDSFKLTFYFWLNDNTENVILFKFKKQNEKNVKCHSLTKSIADRTTCRALCAAAPRAMVNEPYSTQRAQRPALNASISTFCTFHAVIYTPCFTRRALSDVHVLRRVQRAAVYAPSSTRHGLHVVLDAPRFTHRAWRSALYVPGGGRFNFFR